MASSNPLRDLAGLGTSVWYDFIRRDLMDGGALATFIERDDLRGMTTNPSIFAAAVASGDLYDHVIRAQGPKASPQAAYEAIAIEDVQRAADAFRGVWTATDGLDGYVSIEVSPRLAYDAAGTLAEARRLWAAVDRPNAMIKIPGTSAGLSAIAATLADGIPVNVTLLFGIERYREVMHTYMDGLERRHAQGHSLSEVRSVASFFVSRVDTLIDAVLAAQFRATPTYERRGKAGVANARLAYEAFEQTLLHSDRFAALAQAGAHVQRPLWASTSTKDPAYSDTLYVDNLIGPHTVNTMPPNTYDAFRDHGDATVRVRDGWEDARALFAALQAEAGVDMAKVAEELERDGVRKFEAAFDQLLQTVEAKQRALFS